MLRPVHTMGALMVIASVTSGALVASAALTGVNRPASVTLRAQRTNGSAISDVPVQQLDMIATADLVNAERALLGLAPMTWNDEVAAAAHAHSSDMARTGTMQHDGSDGSNAGVRLERQGFDWTGWGETIGAGYATPQPLVAAWMASPGHRQQLTGNFQWVGVAMVKAADGTQFWTLVVANGS